MKKILVFVQCLLIILILGSCGSNGSSLAELPTTETKQETTVKSESTSIQSSTIVSSNIIKAETTTDINEPSETETVNELPRIDSSSSDVTITIPSDIIGDITQEEINNEVEENNYKSGKLNSDGSVTYVISKEQHEEWLEETRNSIKKIMLERIGSEDTPNITDIEVNNDFTAFTITTTNEESDVSERLTSWELMVYGRTYALFSGKSVDDTIIYVDIVNKETGTVIESDNSSDW